MSEPIYHPRIFLRSTTEDARSIILTPEAGLTTDQRWKAETDWLLDRISFDPGLVIDYGCGIGRLARSLSNPVLGVDISQSMRAMADNYVQRLDFAVCSPTMLKVAAQSGLRASGALAVWVLQHVLDPVDDINALANAMLPGAKLYVVNRGERVVPAERDGKFVWVDDQQNVQALLETRFELTSTLEMPESLCVPGATLRSFIRIA
jgi:SAM-dependent methyltransferase